MIAWYSGHFVILQQTAIMALLALSFQVALRSGVFSFAGVAFFAIGGYAAGDLAKANLPVIVTLIVIVAATWALGYLMGLAFARLRGLYLGMVTFALDGIAVIVAQNAGRVTGGDIGLFGLPQQLNTTELLVIVVVAFALISQLERRSVGRSITMLGEDEGLAVATGFYVLRFRRLLMAVSSALGGLAGAVDALVSTNFSPASFGTDLVIAAVTMAVVGGIISWVGAVIGAVLVTWFPDVSQSFASYSQIIYGALLVVVVIYAPYGLVGLARQGWRRISRRSEPVGAGYVDAVGERTVT